MGKGAAPVLQSNRLGPESLEDERGGGGGGGLDADAGQSIDVIARMLGGFLPFFFLRNHLFGGINRRLGNSRFGLVSSRRRLVVGSGILNAIANTCV